MEYYFAFANAQCGSGSGGGDGKCPALQHLQLVPIPIQSNSPISRDSGDDWTKISARDGSDGPSPSPETLGSISHKATHNQLIVDLHELSAFIQARLSDVTCGPVIPGETAEAILGVAIYLTAGELSDCHKSIQTAIDLLENESSRKVSLLFESREGSLMRVAKQIEQAMLKVQRGRDLHESSLNRQEKLESLLQNVCVYSLMLMTCANGYYCCELSESCIDNICDYASHVLTIFYYCMYRC
jgi:hypothetical protein